MHPAPSIIVFSTLSGAGYGLLFLLGGGLALDLGPDGTGPAGLALAVALLLITAGLVSSTRHLTHPERAWRAISQWRSSWLSREGLAALLTYLPAAALAGGLALGLGESSLWVRIAAAITALGAAMTVWCTGMIYRSLKPVRSWHQPLTPWLYVAHALLSGALLFHLILRPQRADGADLLAGLALVLLVVAFAAEFAWRRQGAAADWPTIGRATGLAPEGRVRMVEPPHTQSNYLLDEMAYRIGRKHARRLRLIGGSLMLIAGVSTVGSLALSALPASVAAALAVVAGGTAIAIGRWLFFAEATHTVTLYYGYGGN